MVAAIGGLAPRLRQTLSKYGRLHDCWHAAPLWERELLAAGVNVLSCHEPDPDGQP